MERMISKKPVPIEPHIKSIYQPQSEAERSGERLKNRAGKLLSLVLSEYRKQDLIYFNAPTRSHSPDCHPLEPIHL